MTKCKCDKGDHHKEMTREERLDHLESCMADIIHKLDCVKDEIKELRE